MVRTDSYHVLLQKLGATMVLLRQNNNESLLVSEDFRRLQCSLRKSEEVDIFSITKPFILLLVDPSFSSPYKLSAIEAIETLLSVNSFGGNSIDEESLWTDVIDAIINCKFVQTDVRMDDALQLRIFDTLYIFLDSANLSKLSNEGVWRIIEKCYETYIEYFGGNIYSPIGQCTEKVLFKALSVLVSLTFLSKKISAACVVKCIGYFANILEKTISTAPAGQLSRSVSSLGLSGGNLDPLDPLDSSDVKIITALKCMHSILLGFGDMTHTRVLLSTCRPLLTYCTDDLPKQVLLLCSTNPGPSIFSSALPLVQTLLHLLWPTQKVFIECFVVHVFLKALNHLRTLLQYSSAESDPSLLRSDVLVFDLESIRIILSFLVEMISEPFFIPSLFMSFDCDPSKPNLLLDLVDLLCQTSRYSFYPVNGVNRRLYELAADSTNCLILIFDEMSGRIDDQILIAPDDDANLYSAVSRFLSMSFDAKIELQRGGEQFAQKSSAGIRFLQDKGILNSPLDCRQVARFLRVCPTLPKECVGSFLGELGKDNPGHPVDSKEFHEGVLSSYVTSFEFEGESILRCLRIFLTAFRLPGEAQQIDRILVAFSERAHSQCNEGRNGILENSMVTYLLSFSIIMLQTDLHNPNIREDRKMTIEQFIRNNSNYGADINQTKSLPRDFLENIYYDIKETPIRTERNDFSAVMRSEIWQEMQLSVSAKPSLCHMLTSGYDAGKLEYIFPESKIISIEDLIAKLNVQDTPGKCAKAFLDEDGSELVCSLSRLLSHAYGVADLNIMSCTWNHLVRFGLSPFLFIKDAAAYSQNLVASTLQPAINFIETVLKMAHAHGFQDVVDCIFFILLSFGGVFDKNIDDSVAQFLNCENLVLNLKCLSASDLVLQCGVKFLNNQLISSVSKIAVGTFFYIVQSNPMYLSHRSYNLIFFVLGIMRDCSLLPHSIITDDDSNFIHSVHELEPLIMKNFVDPYDSIRKSYLERFYNPEATHQSFPSKWDDGYHNAANPYGINWLILKIVETSFESDEIFAEAFAYLQDLVNTWNVYSFVSNTRFLSEPIMLEYFKSLCSACEVSDSSHIPTKTDLTQDAIHNFLKISDFLFSEFRSVSVSSCAWFEMIIVDSCFKNRDRILHLWPSICSHYLRLKSFKSISFLNERRIVGLLKLSSRMLSRRHLSSCILDLLHSVFIGDLEAIESIDAHFVSAFSGHVSSGLFRLYTQNVSFLPQLSLNQWKILFDITAIGAKTGGYASVRSFESMAWLLHEPRLRAEVPVFCITALRPILGNTDVPLSVSIGTLYLLRQLHSRLDILFRDSSGSHEEDTPLLWDSCWTPVLEALRDGAYDKRFDVKKCAVMTLFECALDDHADAAPASVVISIVNSILSPCILHLFSLLSISGDDSVLLFFPLDSKMDNKSIISDCVLETNLILFSMTSLSTVIRKNLTKVSTSLVFEKFWIGFSDFSNLVLDHISSIGVKIDDPSKMMTTVPTVISSLIAVVEDCKELEAFDDSNYIGQQVQNLSNKLALRVSAVAI